MITDKAHLNQTEHSHSIHTLAVAARLVGCSASYLRLLAWTGELPSAYKSGDTWLVHVPAVRQYMMNRTDKRRSS